MHCVSAANGATAELDLLIVATTPLQALVGLVLDLMVVMAPGTTKLGARQAVDGSRVTVITLLP